MSALRECKIIARFHLREKLADSSISNEAQNYYIASAMIGLLKSEAEDVFNPLQASPFASGIEA